MKRYIFILIGFTFLLALWILGGESLKNIANSKSQSNLGTSSAPALFTQNGGAANPDNYYATLVAYSQSGPEGGERAVEEAYKAPLDLYGKVVDEHGNPIEGAQAEMKVLVGNGPAEKMYQKLSDAVGMFSITGIEGAQVFVQVKKDGFYQTPESQKVFMYWMRGAKGVSLPTTSESAVVLVLHSKGHPVALISTSLRKSVAKDGSPTEIDIKKGRLTAKEQANIEVEVWTQDKQKDEKGRYPWRYRISVPSGGLIERTDPFAYQAPAEGYKSSDEIEINPADQKKWVNRASRQYFLRLADGSYGRVAIEVITVGDHILVVDSLINPHAGDRNLEYDPAAVDPLNP